MSTLEVLAFKLGEWSVTVQEMTTPSKNWIVPIILGIIVGFML